MASMYRETYSYIDREGNHTSVRLSGRSKEETDEKFQRHVMSEVRKKDVPTVRQFVEEVYRPSFMTGLAATTLANYEQYLRKNILPYMGDMPIDAVNVATLQQFYDWMANGKKHGRMKDLNRNSIARISGLASRIFKVAFEMKIIDDLPFKTTLLRNNGAMGEHHKALPDDEVDRVKRAIPLLKDWRQRLYMALLAYTGMRKEEVLGLRWECVHLAEGYGEVKTVVVFPRNSRAVIKEMPKTPYSQRTFLIPRPLQELLLPYEKETGFVICGENDETPASYSTAQRTYQQAFAILGLKGKYNNHDWRATFGTQLKERGLSSAQVADLMGHADTRMVETTYARTRHEGVMKHQKTLEMINSEYRIGSNVALEKRKKPRNISIF